MSSRLWDRPLDEKAVAWLYEQGRANKPLWQSKPATPADERGERLDVARSATTPGTHRELVPVRVTATRTQFDLSGPWSFLPSERRLKELPETGWSTAAVPGYWAGELAQRHTTMDAGALRRLAEGDGGLLSHLFPGAGTVEKPGRVLHLDGVDGWAELYLNGRPLGRLMTWEDEDFELSPSVEYGRENTLVIACTPGGGAVWRESTAACRSRIVPREIIRDVVVRPSVQHGSIGFSCDLRHEGQPADAQLDFEVREAATPQRVVKRFSHAFRLPASRARPPGRFYANDACECSFPLARRAAVDL